MWTAVIAALIAMFGPQLAELIGQLLDKWFNRAAARLPAVATFGDDRASRLALIEETLKILPYMAFGRRALLRRMRAVVAAGGPTSEDLDEMSDLAAIANNE